MRAQSLRTWLLLVFLRSSVALAGCSAGSVAEMPGLDGKWVLESIDGQAIDSKIDIYFEIRGVTISGYDGCNSFGGSLDDPGQLRMTQRECASDHPQFPLQLSDPRSQLESSELEGDTLEVIIGKTGTASFRRSDSQ